MPHRSYVQLGLFALMGALLPLGACSLIQDFGKFHVADDGGMDGGRDAGPTLTPEDFFTAYLDIQCTQLVRCESKLGFAALAQPFACHKGYRDLFFGQTLLGTEFDFDQMAAEQCLTRYSSVTDCNVLNSDTTDFENICPEAFQGHVSSGGSCISDVECTNGWCLKDFEQCSGTCQPFVAMGGSCSDGQRCDDGLKCRSGTCLPPEQQGGTCGSTEDCDDFLWCPSSTCEPLPKEGEACSVPLFGSDPCRGQLVCTSSATGRTCQVGGDAGDPCPSGNPCSPGHRCNDADVCDELAVAGGSCQSADNCPFAHECINAECTPHGSYGDSCSPLLPCLFGECVSGTCTAQDAGATCDNSFDCAGWCDGAASECRNAIAEGGSCSRADQCVDGLVCAVGGGTAKQCLACSSL